MFEWLHLPAVPPPRVSSTTRSSCTVRSRSEKIKMIGPRILRLLRCYVAEKVLHAYYVVEVTCLVVSYCHDAKEGACLDKISVEPNTFLAFDFSETLSSLQFFESSLQSSRSRVVQERPSLHVDVLRHGRKLRRWGSLINCSQPNVERQSCYEYTEGRI